MLRGHDADPEPPLERILGIDAIEDPAGRYERLATDAVRERPPNQDAGFNALFLGERRRRQYNGGKRHQGSNPLQHDEILSIRFKFATNAFHSMTIRSASTPPGACEKMAVISSSWRLGCQNCQRFAVFCCSYSQVVSSIRATTQAAGGAHRHHRNAAAPI